MFAASFRDSNPGDAADRDAVGTAAAAVQGPDLHPQGGSAQGATAERVVAVAGQRHPIGGGVFLVTADALAHARDLGVEFQGGQAAFEVRGGDRHVAQGKAEVEGNPGGAPGAAGRISSGRG